MAITISNTATLDYSVGGVSARVSSNTAASVLEEALDITKDAYNETYRAGQTVTFIVNVTGDGSTVSALTISDNFGSCCLGNLLITPLTFMSYEYFVDGIREPANTNVNVVCSAGIVCFNFTGLTGFDNITLIYQARINACAPLVRGSRITNTATLCLAGVPVDSDSAVMTVEDYARITVNKTASPETLANGENLTYTFVIQNFGNTSPATFTLSDTFQFARGLPLVAVTVNGVATTNYTYNAGTGLFTIGMGTNSAFIIPPATFIQDPATGAITIIPGELVVTVTGTVRI